MCMFSDRQIIYFLGIIGFILIILQPFIFYRIWKKQNEKSKSIQNETREILESFKDYFNNKEKLLQESQELEKQKNLYQDEMMKIYNKIQGYQEQEIKLKERLLDIERAINKSKTILGKINKSIRTKRWEEVLNFKQGK